MRRVFRNHGLYFVGALGYVISLIPFSGIDLVRALILLPIVPLTLLVVEYLQPSLVNVRIRVKEVVLSALISIPYIFAVSLYLLPPLIILLLTIIFYWKRNLMIGNVLGTVFISSLSFAWLSFVNNSIILPSVYWLLYTLCEALYVEYKLPIRKLDKKVIQFSWLISLIILGLLTAKSSLLLMLLTTIEPSLRFFFPGNKLSSMRDVSKLGKRGAVRSMIFVILLILTSILSLNFLSLYYHY